MKYFILFAFIFTNINLFGKSFFIKDSENQITTFLDDSIKVIFQKNYISIGDDIYEFKINKKAVFLNDFNSSIKLNIYSSDTKLENIEMYDKLYYNNVKVTINDNKLKVESDYDYNVYKNKELVDIKYLKYFKSSSPELLSYDYKLNHSTRLGVWFDGTVNSIKLDEKGNTYLILTSDLLFPEMGDLRHFSYMGYMTNKGNNYVSIFKYNKFNDIEWVTVFAVDITLVNYDLELADNKIYLLNKINTKNNPSTTGDTLLLNKKDDIFKSTENDIALYELNIDGKLIHSTYNGGYNDDTPYDMIIDENKYVWITGITTKSDDLFWTSPNAENSNNLGGIDAFIMCLTPENECIYSSFYGTEVDDYVFSICEMDSLIIMAGMKTNDFENNKKSVGTLTAINKYTYEVEWERSLGSTKYTSIQNIKKYNDNSFIISGYSNESNLATSNVYKTYNSTLSKFIGIFNDKGEITKLTYLGGNDNEGEITTNIQFGDIFLDDFKNIYTIYSSKSTDLNITDDAYNKKNSGNYDVVLNILDKNLYELKYSTYFGGKEDDFGFRVEKYKNSLYFVGKTNSMDIPLTPDAIVNYRYYTDTMSFSGFYTRFSIPRIIDSCSNLAFDINDFSKNEDFILVKDAVVYDSILRLTKEEKFQKSAIWYKNPINILNGFSTEITFRIKNNSNDQNSDEGADGLAFVIQTESNNSIGNSGGGIGYEGIKNAFVAELDLFKNINYEDPNNNHVSVFSSRDIVSSNHNSDDIIAINSDIPKIKRDNSIYKLFITYDIEFNTFTVILEDENFNSEKVIELKDFEFSKFIDLADNKVFIGLTSSTGDKVQRQEILQWNFCGGNKTVSSIEYDNKDIHIFPNPASNYIIINGLNYNNESRNVTIYDFMGNNVLTDKLNNENKIILNNLNRGIYFVKIDYDNETVIKKLIINK